MKVLKFGGTSIADASRIKQVAEIVCDGQPKLVVLSAVAGTTDSLVKIAEAYKHSEFEKVKAIVQLLTSHYHRLIESLYDLEETCEKAKTILESLLSDIAQANVETVTSAIEFHILAKGELLSTELFALYLQEKSHQVTLIPALECLRLTKDNVPDEQFLQSKIATIGTEYPETEIFVTQGFICRNAFGEISNLKRGGSDYSASLFGAALNSEVVEIWTDIDGMHNNDPRYISNTQPIRELSFDEAAELAYFGAKILHPSSIKPARKNNIPVRLLNTLQPNAQGTLISSKTTQTTIKAIAAKSGITAINIKSSEMLQAPGFLRKVFEVFELYHTSIDVITTSEVAVSVTVDDDSYLDAIVKTLAEFGRVKVDSSLTIICVVGDFSAESTGIAAKVMRAVEGIAIRMISYGGSDHNMTLLVEESQKEATLKALHRGLFDV